MGKNGGNHRDVASGPSPAVELHGCKLLTVVHNPVDIQTVRGGPLGVILARGGPWAVDQWGDVPGVASPGAGGAPPMPRPDEVVHLTTGGPRRVIHNCGPCAAEIPKNA